MGKQLFFVLMFIFEFLFSSLGGSMKIFLRNSIIIILALLMVSCGNKAKEPKMYIEKARLSKEEQNIIELLGLANDHQIYDFKLDDKVKSFQASTYELVDGEWRLISVRNQAFTDTQGRYASTFENLAKGHMSSIQSKATNNKTQYTTEYPENITGMSHASTYLSDKTEITYEKEIPLVLQVSTNQSSIILDGFESFFTPEVYVEYGYEHMYAITILFSEKTVGELSAIKKLGE